jgi:hypothetical protein
VLVGFLVGAVFVTVFTSSHTGDVVSYSSKSSLNSTSFE